jgi:hypothetical protein
MKALTFGLVALIAVSACTSSTQSNEPRQSRSHVQPIGGATRADVHIEFGYGGLTVVALDAGADNLATLTYDGPANVQPVSSYHVRDGSGELTYSTDDTNGDVRQSADMRVQLARDFPLALRVEIGAGQSTLDLTGFRMTQLDVQAGASDVHVRLPEPSGHVVVHAESGAAKLTFDVPPDTAADIQVSSALSVRAIDETRFQPLGGGHYRSTKDELAASRIELHAELGAASLTVR